MPAFNWNQQIQGVPPEWRATLGEGVKIALFDTGIDLSHPGLSIPEGRRFNPTDPNFNPQQPALFSNGNVTGGDFNQEHGTISTSILVGKEQGANGMLGIAPSADLYFFRVFDNSEAPKKIYFLKALEAAIALDVDIICMPYFPNLGTGLHEALLQKMSSQNIALFASCRNAQTDPSLINDIPFPANHDNCIAVAALNDVVLSKVIEENFQLEGIDFALPEIKVQVYTQAINGVESIEQNTRSSHAVPGIGGIAALCLAHRKASGLSRLSKQELIMALKSITRQYSALEMRDTDKIQFFHF